MTLQELLVAAPLFLLLTTLIYLAIVSSTRRSAQLTAQAQLQEVATAALQHVEDDLSRTAPAGVGVHNSENEGDGSILCLNQIDRIDSTTGLATSRPDLLVYAFHPARATLVRYLWKPPLPSGISLNPLQPYRPLLDELRTLAATPPGARAVAADVKEFTVTSNAPEGFVGNPLVLHIVLEKKVVAESVERCDLQRTYMLRN